MKNNNAFVEIKENKGYLNMYVTIPNGNDNIIILVNPVVKDKKTIRKLLFKVKKVIE